MKKESFIFIHAMVILLENGCTARESLELLCTDSHDIAISKAALTILAELEKGESLASACITSEIVIEKKYHPYLLQFEQTGAILSSLRLILEDMKRRRETKQQLIAAMVYPLSIIVIALTSLLLLFTTGIPWMLTTGLITDKEVVEEMRMGSLGGTALFSITSGIGIFALLYNFKKKQGEYDFWAMLVSLTEAGLTFDESLAICSRTGTLPYKLDGDSYFFDSKKLDSFCRTTVLSAKRTGDYQSAFKTISIYKKNTLRDQYNMAEKLVEPALMALTGIVLLILALTVFLPLFNQTGRFT